MIMEKVLVAMSGGADSSAVASMLLEQGYYVEGGIMKLSGETDIAPAHAVCSHLGIKLNVFDMRDDFENYVVAPFCTEYENDRTPNPCIACNKHLKFGKLLELALSLGYDKIATGHYARITHENGMYRLSRAKNSEKDQSYVLYNMTQKILSRTLLPLGQFSSKDEIRAYLAQRGVPSAQSKDSQDICFIPNGEYAEFIEKHTGHTPVGGSFVDTSGNIIGQHNGRIRYTVGQRRYLNVSLGKRIYVLGKNAEENTVTLGDIGLLYKPYLICDTVNFIDGELPTRPVEVQAVSRYKKAPVPSLLTPLGDGEYKCEFSTPQRFVSPGQSVVFYDGEYVIGGGIIK